MSTRSAVSTPLGPSAIGGRFFTKVGADHDRRGGLAARFAC